MATLISLGLASIAGLFCVPVLVFFVEVVAALRTVREKPVDHLKSQKCVAVVVPAHDESRGIVPTIEDIKPQLSEQDRLIVVADNCTDDTRGRSKGGSGSHHPR